MDGDASWWLDEAAMSSPEAEGEVADADRGEEEEVDILVDWTLEEEEI